MPIVAGKPKEPKLFKVYVPKVGKLILDISSYLEAEIFVTGSHGIERTVSKRLMDHLKIEGGVFLDVGANIGYHTVPACKLLEKFKGYVIAFEPVRENYKRLVANIKLNKIYNCQIEKLGLSDRNETMEIHHNNKGSGNVSLASEGEYSEIVELVRFDDWSLNNNLTRLDVVKMDIEGAEVKALKGMFTTIKKFKPIFLVEINPMWTKRMGTSTEELIGLLRDLNYQIYNIDYKGVSPKKSDILHRVDPNGKKELNAIAIPTSLKRDS